MQYRYLLLAILCYLTALNARSVLAQVPNSLDSVQVYLKTHTVQDTNYVRALNVLGRELHSVANPDYERADSVLKVSEQLAEKLGYSLGLAKAYTNRASIYYLTNRPQLALAYFQKALTTAETHRLSPRFICGAISNVAAALGKLHHYDKVVEMELRSLKLQEQYNVQPRIATTYGGIGNAFRQMHKPQQALPYYQLALRLMHVENNTSGMSIIENNMGICYDYLERYDQSLKYYKMALKHAEKMKFELLQADILVNIGLALNLSKRSLEAIPFVERSLAIGRRQANKGSMATAYFNLGRIYEDLRQYKPAEENLKKALALVKELDQPDRITDYTQALADLYGGMKNFQEAYLFQLEKNNRTDSVTSVRTNAEVQRLVARYETGKKEAQIKILHQQAQLRNEELEQQRFQRNTFLIGGILLLLLGGSVTAWLLNRARLRRLEDSLKLRKQIAHDLHDEVGSTLSSISLLSGHTDELLSQNRPETARKMVQKIYTDARQILESIDEIVWTINPGNDSLPRIAMRLQEYAQPLMESKNIQFSFVTNPSLDLAPITMEVRRGLYLIGKEAVNNLIKYSNATRAIIRFDYDKGQIVVLIEDNGRGFAPDQNSTRTGQQSMQQRAKALGGELTVQSAPDDGTRIRLVVNG